MVGYFVIGLFYVFLGIYLARAVWEYVKLSKQQNPRSLKGFVTFGVVKIDSPAPYLHNNWRGCHEQPRHSTSKQHAIEFPIDTCQFFDSDKYGEYTT